MQDYTSLFHTQVSTLTEQYRYHGELKQRLNPYLIEVLTEPQAAYEGLIQLIHFDLQDILSQGDSPVEQMFDYLIPQLPIRSRVLPLERTILAEELEEMFHTWTTRPASEESDRDMVAELEEFYHNRWKALAT